MAILKGNVGTVDMLIPKSSLQQVTHGGPAIPVLKRRPAPIPESESEPAEMVAAVMKRSL